MPAGTRTKLGLLILFQFITSTLDILGLYLLGTLASSGILFIQNQEVAFPSVLAHILKFDSSSFQSQFTLVSFLVVLVFCLKTVLAIFGNRVIFLFLGSRAAFASSNLISKLLASKPEYILVKKSQELLYSVTTGMDNLILNYISAGCIFLTETLFLVIIALAIIFLSPGAGLIALIVFGLATFLIHRLTSFRGMSLAKESSELSINYSERILDTLSVYRELFLRNQQKVSSDEMYEVRNLTLRMRAQLLFLPTLSKYLYEFSIIVGGALVGFFQMQLGNANEAIASIVVFIAASTRILPALIRAQNASFVMKQSKGNAQVTLDVVSEIIHMSEKAKLAPNLHLPRVFDPTIEVKNLSFSYPGTTKNALQDLNFSIEAGQFVAIVGQSGAGKSTLVDLILGLYTPSKGEVAISRVPPRDAIRNWPGLISYVPQNISIIGGDISKNIALQDSNQDLKRVHETLSDAHLLREIMLMKNGIHEIVGERGKRLSGGQRQRLGIARALYTNPHMIIFDEATSSLDSVTEKSVTDAIYSKKNKLTLIVIAHRLSTVRNADLVIFLDQGKIAAKGTFDEVRALAPKFDEQAKLVNL